MMRSTHRNIAIAAARRAPRGLNLAVPGGGADSSGGPDLNR